MDLLYRAYSNPLDLIALYINRGQFGAFVQGFLQAEYERKKAEHEKNQEWMLWIAYIGSHSYCELSFNDYKKRIIQPGSSTNGHRQMYTSDTELTEEGALKIIDDLFRG